MKKRLLVFGVSVELGRIFLLLCLNDSNACIGGGTRKATPKYAHARRFGRSHTPQGGFQETHTYQATAPNPVIVE